MLTFGQSDVKGFILAVLYTPVLGFPYLANMMFEIERGDGTECETHEQDNVYVRDIG